MKHRELPVLQSFPRNLYKKPTPNQSRALEILQDQAGSTLLELPTGSGKTAIGYSFLKAKLKTGENNLFYIVPNKTQVDQVKRLHPDMHVAYGRHEYDCLYYEDPFKADEIPCLLLRDCPHRVDQETGQTMEPGVAKCPYYQAKYEAKQPGRMVISTFAFFLFTHLFSREFEKPSGLVIDEVHRLARTFRDALSYRISDYHLGRCVDLLKRIGAEEAKLLAKFKRRMITICKRRPVKTETLLDDDEIYSLLDILQQIKPEQLKQKVVKSIAAKQLDPKEERETLKQLETLVYDLGRYLRSFEFSLSGEVETRKGPKERPPLNYTYAFYKEELAENEKVQYVLVVKAYHVRGLIRKLLSPETLGYSATIGDPKILDYETGIRAKFHSLGSDFPKENTRIYMPSDTANLAMNERNRREPAKTLRRVAQACKKFARRGKRSLVVVISNFERDKFLRMAEEENVKVMTYNADMTPKQAVERFKAGEGDVLLGTAANYGEGLDLPEGIAPVIFFLRPGYPRPDSPETQFEERRHGSGRWGIWNWRVGIEALQVRGRNIRSNTDRGVTFFVSQQFKRFVFGTLPQYLQPSYRSNLTFDQSVDDALKLLR